VSDASQLLDWNKAVQKRDGGRCRITGGQAGDKAHHIIRRKYRLFRYDPDNGISLTPEMHGYVHDNPKLGMRLVIVAIGPALFAKLRKAFKDKYHWDYFEEYVCD
jgi:hypothetical protein